MKNVPYIIFSQSNEQFGPQKILKIFSMNPSTNKVCAFQDELFQYTVRSFIMKSDAIS